MPSTVDVRRALLEWWAQHGRTFAWRTDRTPYRVLVSELLLHRTRAGNAARVYQVFLGRYPAIRDLAEADSGELAELLKPLGLRWRVDLIVEMAREIMSRHGGEVPCDRDALLRLPGVGEYMASAVSVFGCGKVAPLLDTNIVRILGRLHGLRVTDASRRSRHIASLVLDLVDESDPASSYYALVDLGALVCRPSNPRCTECPLRETCRYAAGIRDSSDDRRDVRAGR
jgi:A/G-specific adenine glycosylase